MPPYDGFRPSGFDYYYYPNCRLALLRCDWTINGMIEKMQDLNMFSSKPRDSQTPELSLVCHSGKHQGLAAD